MSISLSIASLFSNTFGIESDEFDFSVVIGNKEDDILREEFGSYGTPYYKTDQFGREGFLPVTVSFPDKDKIITSLVTGNVNMLKSWDLPFPVLSVSGQKILVETPMTERVGSVIEQVGFSSWEINIKGFFINKYNEYPEELEKQMKDVFLVGSSVIMRNAKSDIYLNDLGYNVVIKSFNTPQVVGVKNVIAYDLKLISNAIFDLEEIGE